MTTTVIVAYFVQPSNTLGGQAKEIVDLSSDERYRERLRNELGLPSASVRLFREGKWGMRPVESRQDLKRSDVYAEFVGHAAVALEGLQVAEKVVTRFAQGQFEELYLPTTGRVILFQVITARRSMLGQLVEANNTSRVTKKDVLITLSIIGSWFVGTSTFFAISGRLDDEPITTIAIMAIGIASIVGTIVVYGMENARRRLTVVAVLVIILIVAALLSAEELAYTTLQSD